MENKEDFNRKGLSVGSIITGMNIVLIGLIFLFGNIGIVDFGYLPYFWKLWPLILIGIGLNMILVSNGIKYIGVSVVSLVLILILVGSSVSQAGVQTRALLGINENPIEFSWNNIGNYFSREWCMLGGLKDVKQTFEGSINISESFNTVEFIQNNNQVDSVSVRLISSTDTQKAEYIIGVKSDMEFSDEPTPIIDIRKDGFLSIGSPDLQGSHFNISLTLYINTESNIFFPNLAESFSIEGEWLGDIKAINLGSGNFFADRLMGKCAIKTSSGNIKCTHVSTGEITNTSGSIDIEEAGQLDIKSISGDVFLGRINSANMKLTSGDIRCDEIINIALIQSTSGDVEIGRFTNTGISSIGSVSGDIGINSFSSNSGAVELRSISGDIALRIIQSVDSDSNSIGGEITTASGDIDALGIELNHNQFTIGSGECRMVLRTTSGDINITNSER